MNVQSASFQDGGTIPQKHAFNEFGCTGENLSPQLAWSGVPNGAKSFALVMHDPDAPTSGGFYHWVAFNIPSDTRELKEGAGSDKLGSMIHGVVLGHTDYGTNAYGGPCPPPGAPHRYDITIYALDVDKLPLDKNATGAMVEFTVSQHTLGKANITGLYGR